MSDGNRMEEKQIEWVNILEMALWVLRFRGGGEMVGSRSAGRLLPVTAGTLPDERVDLVGGILWTNVTAVRCTSRAMSFESMEHGMTRLLFSGLTRQSQTVLNRPCKQARKHVTGPKFKYDRQSCQLAKSDQLAIPD